MHQVLAQDHPQREVHRQSLAADDELLGQMSASPLDPLGEQADLIAAAALHVDPRDGALTGGVRQSSGERRQPLQHMSPKRGDVERIARGRAGIVGWIDTIQNISELGQDGAKIIMNAHDLQPRGCDVGALEDSRQAPPTTALPADTRALIDPTAMLRAVAFAKHPPVESLDGLIAHGWHVEWALPGGAQLAQDVLPFPAVNVSVGTAPPEGADPGPGPFPVRTYVTGMTRTLSRRVLSASGRNVALRSTIGGFAAWVDDVRDLQPAGREIPPEQIGIGLNAEDIHAMPIEQAIHELMAAAADALARRPARAVRDAREVASWTRRAEEDPRIRTVEQWARAVGVSSRTLQRLIPGAVGAGPSWILRRFRLLAAIERARTGCGVRWAQVAADLGYADQAHLSRAVKDALGVSQREYAARQTEPRPAASNGSVRPPPT